MRLTRVLMLIGITAVSFNFSSARATDSSPKNEPRQDQLQFREIYRELLETNTTHSAGDCTAAEEKMVVHLKAAGYADRDIHLLTVPEHAKDGSLVVTFAGTRKSLKPVLLLAHVDVVEARREDWPRDPFTLVEENGYFYARGAYDDKSMAAVWVDSMLRFKHDGYHPARGITLALTCGEEGGSDFNGAEYLAQHERSLIDAEFALNEFAWGVLDDQGHRIVMEVQVGEKTSQNYRLEVTNPGGHSSRPVKDNAIYALAAGLTRVSNYGFPIRLNSTIRTYLERMSGIVGGERGAAMRALLANPNDNAAAAELTQDPRLNAMLRTTCVATLLDAGHATNALPQRASANINCRLFPGVGAEEVRKTLEEVVADARIHVITVDMADPSVQPPPITPAIFKPIEETTKQFYPGIQVVPVLQAAGTDAVYLVPVGIPVYGVSGMFIDPDLGNVHGLNERIRVQSLYDGRDFLYALIKRYTAH